MNALCPVCRFPLRRTKRGGLVCGASWASSPKQMQTHDYEAFRAERWNDQWKWLLREEKGTADLTKFTRNRVEKCENKVILFNSFSGL